MEKVKFWATAVVVAPVVATAFVVMSPALIIMSALERDYYGDEDHYDD